MTSFPTNPTVGQLHTNNHGQTYEYTEKGTWRAVGGNGNAKYSVGTDSPQTPNVGDYWFDTNINILKIWERDEDSEQWTNVGSRPVVAPAAPSNPFSGLIWFNSNELNLYMYVVVNGTGSWKVLASAAIIAEQTVIAEVLPLTWQYDDERFNFELFIDNPAFNFRNINPRLITGGLAGDDSLDLDSTDGIFSGEWYVLFHPTEGLKDVVRVNSKLSNQRLKIQSILGTTYGPGGLVGAYLARTSFIMENDGTATVKNGDIFFTRPLNALEIWPNGELALRRTATGTGEFTIKYKYPDDTIWINAALLQTRSVDANWRDEIYDIRTTGIIDIQISYSNSDSNARETLDHIALYGAPQNSDTTRMERPTNISPADGAFGILSTPTLTGSAYRNVFGIAQDGAHFQVALDSNFSQLIVNTSSDALASWVAVSGQTDPFKGVLNYGERRFIAVGDAGAIVRTIDGGKTFSDLTFANSSNLTDIAFNGVDQVMVSGASGTIANSQDNGDTWVVATPAGGYAGQFNGIAANGSYAVVVGTSAEIQVTTNGGSIWNKRTAPNSYIGDYKAVDMSGTNMLAVGTLGQIASSSNNGSTFIKRTPANAYAGTFNAVAMRDDGRAIVVGTNGEVQRTEDYGATFQRIALPDASSVELKGVAIQGDNVVIVGIGGAIYTSDNNGISFVKRPTGSGSTADLYAASIDEENYSVIFGAGGAVQRTLRLEGVFGTSFTVPEGSDMLKINQIYWWRVRYRDAVGFWSLWSIPTAFSTSNVFSFIYQPQNLSPASGATNVAIPPTLQSTSFLVFGTTDSHIASKWQISSDSAFSSLLYDSGDKTDDKISINVPGGIGMVDQGTYYWRVAHKGANLGYSAWSVPTAFKAVNVPSTPTIVTPANAAVGVAATPTITTSMFSSTVPGEIHDKSQYQVSTNPAFTALVYDSGEVTNLTSQAIPNNSALPVGGTYYIRARHKGLNTGWSRWSTPNVVTTAKPALPTLASPANGATNVSTQPTLTSSAFSSQGADTHAKSQWQISTAANFATIAYDSGESNNLLSNPVPGETLNGTVLYYARVRHKGTISGWSDWSTGSSFTTAVASVPAIVTPSAGSTGQSVLPTFESSAFNSAVTGDSHVASKWQVSTTNSTSGLVVDTAELTNAKLAFTVTGTPLAANVQHYVRVQHKGATSGLSGWSSWSSFTPASANTPSIASPTSGATGVLQVPTLISTAFYSGTTESHESSQWQVSSSPSFTSPAYDSGASGSLTSITLPITLSPNTQYYTRVRHKGSASGWSSWSTVTPFTTAAAPGQAIYTSPGTQAFVVPAGVTSVCVVCIGGGGNGSPGYNESDGPGSYGGASGGGGGLRYINDLTVTPGQSIPVTVGGVGGTSSFGGAISAYGGGSGWTSWSGPQSSGSAIGAAGAGGGGAGGFGGNGGTGGGGGHAGGYSSNSGASASIGGSGAGLYGNPGNSGGTYNGGAYGGGGIGGDNRAYSPPGSGASGAVRVMWGPGRSFPNNAG